MIAAEEVSNAACVEQDNFPRMHCCQDTAGVLSAWTPLTTRAP